MSAHKLTAAQREFLIEVRDALDDDGRGHPLHTGYGDHWAELPEGLVDIDLCSCDLATAYTLTDAGRAALDLEVES